MVGMDGIVICERAVREGNVDTETKFDISGLISVLIVLVN